jgi:hypothetical protein
MWTLDAAATATFDRANWAQQNNADADAGASRRPYAGRLVVAEHCRGRPRPLAVVIAYRDANLRRVGGNAEADFIRTLWGLTTRNSAGPDRRRRE